jgi:hypothetical protein
MKCPRNCTAHIISDFSWGIEAVRGPSCGFYHEKHSAVDSARRQILRREPSEKGVRV